MKTKKWLIRLIIIFEKQILCLTFFQFEKKCLHVIIKGSCEDQIKCFQADEVELVYYIIVF